MSELTDRQTRILKALMEEYIESAAPVGSETLEKKYSLGVSPATVRNELVRLTKMGFLNQPHTSSGRTPTPLAIKFYIQKLMESKELGVADEVAVKEKIWDSRHQLDKFFQEVARALAQKTNSLALVATDEGKLFHSGYAHILDMPEFFDIDTTKGVLSVIEDVDRLLKFFDKATGEEVVHALIGQELELEPLYDCSLVFTNFEIKGKVKGSLGVIGPCRLNYPLIIPTIKYFGHLLEEVLGSL